MCVHLCGFLYFYRVLKKFRHEVFATKERKMWTSNLVQISENCWKHTSCGGNVFYRKTSNQDSDLHREDGPAIEYVNGDKICLINHKRHRKNGPAVERANGDKEWFFEGKLHREDGPAVEWINGDKEWWFGGQRVIVSSQEDFEKWLKKYSHGTSTTQGEIKKTNTNI